MSNTSKGFERGSNAKLVQFLYIAKASGGEVRCQLTVAFDPNEFDEIFGSARKVSGIIGNLINYLRRSKMKGSKFKPTLRKSRLGNGKKLYPEKEPIEPLNFFQLL